jgi:hypothetical protein
LPTRVPMILKSISSPFSFSMIFGWPLVMEKFFAVPRPVFVTMSPS